MSQTHSLEKNSNKDSQSYAARLEELQNRRGHEGFISMATANGSSTHTAGEDSIQPLPLAVSIDGRPMQVLFTASVGNMQHQDGSMALSDRPDVAKTEAIAQAAKTFAIVRAPFSFEAPQLLVLTDEELATGQCDYSPITDGHEKRFHQTIPGSHQDGLHIRVPLGVGDYAPAAHLTFNVIEDINRDELTIDSRGPNGMYTMVAAQV